MKKLARIARWLADVVPPTGRGWLVAGLSGAALWFYGFEELDLVLFVVGLAGLFLIVVSCLVVGITALVLRRKLRPAPAATRILEAASLIRTGFRVPALGYLPMIHVKWEWREPAGVVVRPRWLDGWWLEEVTASRRALVPGIVRRITVHDVFGLSRVAWLHVEPCALTIFPSVGLLRNMPVVQSMAGGEGIPHPGGAPEGDRMDIRRYAAGDPVRNILWKVYARTRQLNIRMPERAIERKRRIVAYLMAGPWDEPAAAAARVAVESGALGDSWVFGADGTTEPTSDPELALRAIARSAQAEPGNGLSLFMEAVASKNQVHCIVFAPARPGPWLAVALDAARRYQGAVSFVLGTDGVIRRAAPPLWRRLLVVEAPAVGTPAGELSELLQKLSSAGASSLVVDRLSGRPYGHAHQKALGALAS